MATTDDAMIICSLIVLACSVGTWWLYPARSEMAGKSNRATWWWLANLAAVIMLLTASQEILREQTDGRRLNLLEFLPRLVSPPLLFIFLGPLFAKLFATWIGGHVSDQERAGGREAVRAWLRGRHLFIAAAITACAAVGLNYSPWGVGALCLLVLLAHPVVTSIFQEGDMKAETGQDRDDERNRVLNLLEQGKITAEESAELLSALSDSTPPRVRPIGSNQKLLWCGAAVVLVGFLLPWFSIDLGAEMKSFMNKMPVPGGFPSNSSPEGLNWNWSGSRPPEGMPKNYSYGQEHKLAAKVSVSGSQTRHGLGWLVLIGAAVAAAVPLVAADQTAQRQRQFIIAALLIAGVVLLVIASDSPRHISIGIPVAAAGLVMQALAVMRDARPVARMTPSVV